MNSDSVRFLLAGRKYYTRVNKQIAIPGIKKGAGCKRHPTAAEKGFCTVQKAWLLRIGRLTHRLLSTGRRRLLLCVCRKNFLVFLFVYQSWFQTLLGVASVSVDFSAFAWAGLFLSAFCSPLMVVVGGLY